MRAPDVSAAEFDKFADDYRAIHQRNIALSGEKPDYFARYKIDIVRRLWTRGGLAEPRVIMDFGCGVGNSLPHLADAFQADRLIGLDVSERSLALARAQFPGIADLVLHGDGPPPVPAGSVDLIFSSCVFHHIDAAEHVGLMRSLREALAPGGRLVIFEHNPLNPVTRHIVATCPFDEDAVLIGAGELRRRQRAAGFTQVSSAYCGVFPAALKALRPLEPALGALLIGAQYYTVAHD
jgi:SAM-dependent methyltransferase